MVDAMIFVEPFLGITPESFNAIDVIVGFAKSVCVVNLVMLSKLLQ